MKNPLKNIIYGTIAAVTFTGLGAVLTRTYDNSINQNNPQGLDYSMEMTISPDSFTPPEPVQPTKYVRKLILDDSSQKNTTPRHDSKPKSLDYKLQDNPRGDTTSSTKDLTDNLKRDSDPYKIKTNNLNEPRKDRNYSLKENNSPKKEEGNILDAIIALFSIEGIPITKVPNLADKVTEGIGKDVADDLNGRVKEGSLEYTELP